MPSQLVCMLRAALLGACMIVCALSSIGAQTLSYKGSETIGGTVLPEIIKEFQAKTGIGFATVETPGAAAGWKAVMAGEVAVAGMTRALTKAEREERPYFIVMGFDALSIYVHPNNPLKNLSKEQVKEIFTGAITQWQQVGGAAAPIVALIADTGRANVQEFQRKVLDGASFAPTVRVVSSYDEILHHIATNGHAITFASIALKRSGVKIIDFDGVAPSHEAVRQGGYLLQQPLLLVAKKTPSGALEKFFNFVQSVEGQRIVAKYFIPYQGLRAP